MDSYTIAFDPGQTTGIAVLYDGNQLFTKVLDHTKILYWLNRFHAINISDVVVERFATAGRLSKYGLLTIELVGMLEGFCYAKGIKFHLQTPMSREGMKKDAEDYIGAIFHKEHEIDALAHLLLFLSKKGEDFRHLTYHKTEGKYPSFFD